MTTPTRYDDLRYADDPVQRELDNAFIATDETAKKPRNITCRYCGEINLRWAKVNVKWRLVNTDGYTHRCW
jgi:hypothetical protein